MLSLRERRVAVVAVVCVARAVSSSFTQAASDVAYTRTVLCCSRTRAVSLPLRACCFLVATGGSTNRRRHRLPVLSLRERRVAVWLLWCVWHALIVLRSCREQVMLHTHAVLCSSRTRAVSLALLACCSLVATGGSTNTRRHRLSVLSSGRRGF